METAGTLYATKNNNEPIRSFKLELGDNIIGRPSKEKPSTIEIEGDKKLSRQHFVIKVSKNEDGIFMYLLRDNDSLNGTQILSGKKKKKLSGNEEIRLQNGDVIKAGENIFFELEISDLETEEPTEDIPKHDIGIISVPTTKGGKTEYVMAFCEEISHITADGNYSYLYLDDEESGIIWANKNLRYFEDLLRDKDYIVRIHDSTIINVKKMKSYNIEGRDGRVILETGAKFIVSRTYKDSFEKKLSIKK